MRRREFLLRLKGRLSGLTTDKEIKERLDFYNEMIDDRMEDGLSEDAAVAAIGSVEKISAQIINDIKNSENRAEKPKQKRRLGAWEIVLLALGSPIWLSLLVVAASVVIALFAVLLAVVLSLWAVFASLCAGGIGGVVGCIILLIGGGVSQSCAFLGCGLVLGGLSIFTFFGCLGATRGASFITCRSLSGIAKLFVRREKR